MFLPFFIQFSSIACVRASINLFVAFARCVCLHLALHKTNTWVEACDLFFPQNSVFTHFFGNSALNNARRCDALALSRLPISIDCIKFLFHHASVAVVHVLLCSMVSISLCLRSLCLSFAHTNTQGEWIIRGCIPFRVILFHYDIQANRNDERCCESVVIAKLFKTNGNWVKLKYTFAFKLQIASTLTWLLLFWSTMCSARISQKWLGINETNVSMDEGWTIDAAVKRIDLKLQLYDFVSFGINYITIHLTYIDVSMCVCAYPIAARSP